MINNIPAGYQLHINSWENDCDAYKIKIVSGLTEEDVRFYLELARTFDGPLGNEHATSGVLDALIKATLKKHPKISQKVSDKFNYDLGSSTQEEIDESDRTAYDLVVEELLCDPVDDYFNNEAWFCRNFSSAEVYFFEHPVQDVTSMFSGQS